MSVLDVTRRYAIELTSIPSVNGTAGEVQVVQHLYDHLCRHPACHDGRMLIHLVPCPDDPLGRQVLIAHLRGTEPVAVMLMGHVDTVGTYDYGDLEPLAFNPVALTEKVAGGALGEQAAERARSGKWLFGRGLLDMKSGVAAALVAFEAFAAEGSTGHLLFVATPDEEVDGRGVLTLGPWVKEYTRSEGIRVTAVLNSDYTAGRPSDVGAKPIYLGSIGNLTAGAYVRGRPSHVGEPESGLDPNALLAAITNRVVYGQELVDRDGDETTQVPVSLYQRDDKPSYDVQTAVSASAYYNLFYMRRPPGKQLGRFHALAKGAVEEVRRRYARFATPPDIPVYTVEELWERAPKDLRDDVATRHSVSQDVRQQSKGIVADLVAALSKDAPMVAVYFAMGLWPAVRSGEDVRSAVEAATLERERAGRERFVLHRYFPYISDLSFLAPSADWQDEGFRRNFPPFLVAPVPDPIIFETAAVMVGTYGTGAHRPDESVDVEYTFGELPQLLMAMVRRLWTRQAGGRCRERR